MAQWQRKIDLKDVWDSKDVPLIAKTLSTRLRALEPLGDDRLDWTREELADQFEDIEAVDEFDAVMSELYDWADTKLDHNWNGKKVCWIATF